MPEPSSLPVVRLPMRRIRMGLLGAMMALLTLPFLAIFIWRFPFLDGFVFADFLAICGMLGFGAFAAFGLGVAWRNPIGLRLDQHGISGYYCKPIRWDEIAEIGPTSIGHTRLIGVKLTNTEDYTARLSPFAQVMRWGQPGGFDATIGIAHLKVPSTEVMDLIKSYHAAYGTAQS